MPRPRSRVPAAAFLVALLLAPLAAGTDAAPRAETAAADDDGWVLRVPPAQAEALRRAAERRGLDLGEAWPAAGLFRLAGSEADARMLAAEGRGRAEPDLVAQATLWTASRWSGILRVRERLGLTGDLDGKPSFSADDVGICVLDTGVDVAHPDLDGGKVRAWRDFVNASRTSPIDDHGHGTHVASIAAGTGDADPAHAGAAPGAWIAAAKVLDAGGRGPISRIIQGVAWCLEQPGVRVLNLSLGTGGCSDGDDALSAAVDDARDRGFVVVAAAGNAGPARCTIGSPGAARGALTVGAMADLGEDGFRLASFSGRGPTLDGRAKPDLVAPGVRIKAADAGTSGYVEMSGTSMAAPLVAGVAALLLDADPALQPEDVRRLLRGTTGDWGARGADHDWGAGRLRAFEAVSQAANASGAGPPVGKHRMWRVPTLASGASWTGTVDVASSSQGLALTLLLDGDVACATSCKPDLDLFAYAPGTDLSGTADERHGRAAASSQGVSRQEQLSVEAPAPGRWTLEVYGYAGNASAILDAGYR